MRPAAFADAVDAFPAIDDPFWKGYLHVNETKYCNVHPDTWAPGLQEVARELTSPGFVTFLEELTGIRGLLPDWSMDGGGLHQLGTQLLGLAAVGAFTFGASFLVLLLFKVTVGIRTEPHVESAGLDVSEHGMWGYPEFYIPVPGVYGTEHSGGHGLAAPAPAGAAMHAMTMTEPTV